MAPAPPDRFLSNLARTRDKVLDGVRLAAGDRLLDVGCGEGLIAFGALERGADSVMFSDISKDLLDFCREIASDIGVLDRCEFVQTSADDLAAIDDASVDVVTTRSVLIYVKDKATAAPSSRACFPHKEAGQANDRPEAQRVSDAGVNSRRVVRGLYASRRIARMYSACSSESQCERELLLISPNL